MYEALDNRRRRNKIRVRGIPKSVDTDQIIPALQHFNSLLERQEDTEIDFVHAHRALRARDPESAPPREIICCLQNFPLKEDLMHRARKTDCIRLNRETIMLFQDLSQITLRNHRALHPLLYKLTTQCSETFTETRNTAQRGFFLT